MVAVQKVFIILVGYIVLSTVIVCWDIVRLRMGDQTRLVVCDVGQGDGILVVSKSGKKILIDTGPDLSILECLGRELDQFDRSVDYIFITHDQYDHTTGYKYIVKRYENSHAYTNILYKDSTKESKLSELDNNFILKNNNRISFLHAGDVFAIDNILVTVLWPYPDYHPRDANDASLVLLLEVGSTKILFTGDATRSVWRSLLARDQLKNIDILKVSHHGAKNGTMRTFLQATRPELALISVGRHNQFGHPAAETLVLLEEAGVEVRRTDLEGTITIDL